MNPDIIVYVNNKEEFNIVNDYLKAVTSSFKEINHPTPFALYSRGGYSSKGYAQDHYTDECKLEFREFAEKFLNKKEMKTIKKYNVKEEFKVPSKGLFEGLKANPDETGGWGSFNPTSKMKDFYEKAGVLDIWFDKEFEDEYKVGDWIVLKKGYDHTEEQEEFIGIPLKLTKIDKEGDRKEHPAIYFEGQECWTYYYENIDRKATPEEIEKATVREVAFTVGKPKVQVYINSKGVIKVKDIEFRKTDLDKLIKLSRQRQSIKTYEAKITSIWVGCKEGTELTVQDIRKIETEYNKLNNVK